MGSPDRLSSLRPQLESWVEFEVRGELRFGFSLPRFFSQKYSNMVLPQILRLNLKIVVSTRNLLFEGPFSSSMFVFGGVPSLKLPFMHLKIWVVIELE